MTASRQRDPPNGRLLWVDKRHPASRSRHHKAAIGDEGGRHRQAMPTPATLSLSPLLLDDGELRQDIPKVEDERVQARYAVSLIGDQDRKQSRGHCRYRVRCRRTNNRLAAK